MISQALKTQLKKRIMGTCCGNEYSERPVIDTMNRGRNTQNMSTGETILPPATDTDDMKPPLLLSVSHSIKNDPNHKEPITDYQVIYDDKEEGKMGLIKGVEYDDDDDEETNDITSTNTGNPDNKQNVSNE